MSGGTAPGGITDFTSMRAPPDFSRSTMGPGPAWRYAACGTAKTERDRAYRNRGGTPLSRFTPRRPPTRLHACMERGLVQKGTCRAPDLRGAASPRHAARIIGLAAVNGRHALMFDDRLQPDVWYVDHCSLRLDIKTIALTADQVLRRTDVSTMQDLGEVGFRLPGAGRVRVHGPNAGFGRPSGPSNLLAELRSCGFDVDGTRAVSVSQTLGERAESSPR